MGYINKVTGIAEGEEGPKITWQPLRGDVLLAQYTDDSSDLAKFFRKELGDKWRDYIVHDMTSMKGTPLDLMPSLQLHPHVNPDAYREREKAYDALDKLQREWADKPGISFEHGGGIMGIHISTPILELEAIEKPEVLAITDQRGR